MSTETTELNRLFNNISGGTVDLKLPQTKWLQKINERIEVNGIGGGSSYKGVTVLSTETAINGGSELPTTYDFNIYSYDTISSIEEYWGDGEKQCLLIHTLNNGETVLTPAILTYDQGTSEYSIQTPNGNMWFSSVEIQDQNTIVAYLDNAQDFNDLENDLKTGSIIQNSNSSSDEILIAQGRTIPNNDIFALDIFIPEGITDQEAIQTYLESANFIFWFDNNEGLIHFDICKITISNNPRFQFFLDNVRAFAMLPKEGMITFIFATEAKETFVSNSVGNSSSGGPNYQVISTLPGTIGNLPSDIDCHKIEVDENYMLLRLTYQIITEGESPIERKVFSIINIDEGKYYVVWNIERNHTIYKTTEGDPQPTSSYLEFYPNIVGFYDDE